MLTQQHHLLQPCFHRPPQDVLRSWYQPPSWQVALEARRAFLAVCMHSTINISITIISALPHIHICMQH